MSHLDELLSVYLDGEASPAEAARVNQHLAACPRCRRQLSEVNAARSAVRSLPLLELPASIGRRFQPPTVPLTRRPSLWVGAAAAVAAAVVTVATITTPPREPMSLSDVSRQIGARASLESGTASIKLVVEPAGSE